MRPWKIQVTPRSIALRNRRGKDRENFVRMDAYIEEPDLKAVREAADHLGITQSDAFRSIVREAVENGILITPMGKARLFDFLPDAPALQLPA